MKKTLHIDQNLLADAKRACGASTDTDTVRLGLEALIRHAAIQTLHIDQNDRSQGTELLASCGWLPRVATVDHSEVVEFVRARRLSGRGIG